jgi:hypothetical protein
MIPISTSRNLALTWGFLIHLQGGFFYHTKARGLVRHRLSVPELEKPLVELERLGIVRSRELPDGTWLYEVVPGDRPREVVQGNPPGPQDPSVQPPGGGRPQ